MKQLITITLLLLFYQSSYAGKAHVFEQFIGISREELTTSITIDDTFYKIIEMSDTVIDLISVDHDSPEEHGRIKFYLENDMVHKYSLFVTCSLCFMEYCELLHITKKWIKYPESNYYNRKTKVHLKIEDVRNDINFCKKLTYSLQKPTIINLAKGKKRDYTAYSLLDTNNVVISQAILKDTNVTKRDSIISEILFLELSNSACLSVYKSYFIYDRDTKKLKSSEIYDSMGIVTNWSLYDKYSGMIYYKVEFNIENSVIMVDERRNNIVLQKGADYTVTYYNEDGEITRIKNSRQK